MLRFHLDSDPDPDSQIINSYPEEYLNVIIIIIIINNQPTDKVQRPVGCNTMKTGLSSSTC